MVDAMTLYLSRWWKTKVGLSDLNPHGLEPLNLAQNWF